MAESTGSNRGLGQPPDRMSTETRLLLAFLLMGAIMFLTPYFFKSQPPAPNAKKSTQAGQAAETTAPPTPADVQPPAEAVEAGKAPGAPVIQAPAEPPFVVNTDLYRITFSNEGATVRSWQLKKSLADGKPLELVNTAAAVEDSFPFSLYMAGHKVLAKRLNAALYRKTVDPDGLGVTFDYSDGHTTVRKTFRFRKDSYLGQISSEVDTDGQPIDNSLEWRGGFCDFPRANSASKQQTIYFDLTANSLKEQTVSAAKNGPATNSGNFSFAGIEDGYFTAAFLPEGNAVMQEVTFSDTTRTPLTEKPAAFTGAAVSMGAVNHFRIFVGPKDYDLLKRVDPKLEQLINFGMLSILAKPLFLVVNWFNDNVVHNFGWAIIVVTVIINFALFPLKLANMKSMRKMQALKPQVDTINAKYKNTKSEKHQL